MIPCSYRASTCMAVLPSCITSYVISVRQTRDLPAGFLFPTSGFLQIPSHDRHPCLRLYPSHYRADSGLAPVGNVRRRAHHKKQSLSQNRPCFFFFYPHTSSAISFTSASFAHCSSSVSLFPISQEANPHCGLKYSRSRGMYFAAS